MPAENEKLEADSNVQWLQEVACLLKGFTPRQCGDDKRTRAVNEVADGNEETLLKPLALVNARLSETPISHPGSVPAKLPPVKKQDGFYSDW
ncbi:hypothetical protein LSAT2_016791 [Lamellibrachia satsuma]|nr:hypothetical protein LSAT2_016791 [Lamellibrachia satsuma]